MEKLLTKINIRILDLKYQGISAWTFILKSKVTMAIILVIMIAVLSYFNYFFYEILFRPLWIIFLLLTIFVLITVILPGFLLVGGTDIYKNMRELKVKPETNSIQFSDKVKSETDSKCIVPNNIGDSQEFDGESKMTGNNITEVGNTFEIDLDTALLENISTPEPNVVTFPVASDDSIKTLYEHFKDKGFFDITLVKNESQLNNLEPARIFEFEYFKGFINDMRVNGETTERLYLFADQKTVGFLIFEVFKPITKRDSSKISDYFYYYQFKNGFKPINYEAINSRSKRSIHAPTQKFLPEFFLKFRSDL